VHGAPAAMGSLAGYLTGPDPGEVPTWQGELRSAARAHLLPNVVSNRAGQKLRRAQAEAALERYAEPLAALVPGAVWPAEELDRAWRLLLWNGAHDSVCGCGVDEVARAVDERCAEAEAIAASISERALERLAGRMAHAGWMYFNPSPFERDGVPGLGWRINIAPTVHPSIEFDHDERGIAASGLHVRLVDEGDVGDLYTFCPAPQTPRREPSSYRVQQGLRAVFDDGLSVHLSGAEDAAGPVVKMTCRIDNARPDHRLRLHVALRDAPSGSVALSAFEVVERPLLGEGGTETPSATWPARGAVMAGGVAVLGDGAFEYEVIPDPPELAITLLRCVGTISRESIATRPWPAGPNMPTPEAQMMGSYVVSFTIRPAVSPQDLPAEWERRHLPMRAVRTPGGGDLPESGSLLPIEGAELSSIRLVDGEVDVRVWNPSNAARPASVGGRRFELRPARIETVRLPLDSQHFQ
jgi:alpha-mannosidase